MTTVFFHTMIEREQMDFFMKTKPPNSQICLDATLKQMRLVNHTIDKKHDVFQWTVSPQKRHSKLRHASTAQELNILLKQFDMVISLHTYSHVIPTVIVSLFWLWIYVEFQGSSRTCSTFGGVLLSLTLDGNVPMIFLLYTGIYFGRGPPSSSDHKDILCTRCHYGSTFKRHRFQ